ncbi:MAG TPA: PQQ-dependent sugar dehydrogenase [Mariniphaga sp.]|nr:PQQ-dependent sugar dehydrogenase [Mariniphaga sp.]
MKTLKHLFNSIKAKQQLTIIGIILLTVNPGCSQSISDNADDNCVYITDGIGNDGTISVKAETVVDGLEVPWGIAFLPNGDMLVTERPGRIRMVKNYAENPELIKQPVATISTANTSEGGLLGIAIHPDFISNRLFYIYVTVDQGNDTYNQVEQWRLAKDGTTAEQVKVIFDNIQASRNHNGGRVAFGPDNMLYVGTGDASSPSLSQDPESPNGKLLRITPDGEIPEDNPISGNPMYLMGIRNTQGWAWPDPDDASELWFTDHGPSGERMRFGHDEMSIARAGDNLGWPDIYRCETKNGMITPSIVWKDAAPPGGAAIYTGDAIPEWKGSFLIGTLGSSHLQRIVIENQKVTTNEVYFKDDFGRIREVIQGPDGHLYITTSNCDGRGNCQTQKDVILRISK